MRKDSQRVHITYTTTEKGHGDCLNSKMKMVFHIAECRGTYKHKRMNDHNHEGKKIPGEEKRVRISQGGEMLHLQIGKGKDKCGRDNCCT